MRLRRTRWWHAVIAVIALVTGGCTDDDDPDADRLAEELIQETDGALDEEQAVCVADALILSFGDDSFQAVVDAANGDGERADDVRVEVIDIFAACDALGAVVLEDDEDTADDAG